MALVGVVLALVWRLEVQPFRKGKRADGRQRWALAAIFAAALFLIWFLPYSDRPALLTFADAAALRYAGLVLHTSGSALGLVALRTLGKQYSAYVTVQEDHQPVRTGIFSVIRHPIYLRAILVSVGLPLVFRSWLGLPLVVLVTSWLVLRIRQEEKLLAEHFGAEFEAYRRRTWRLLPYVY